jgi:hypothetical protein
LADCVTREGHDGYASSNSESVIQFRSRPYSTNPCAAVIWRTSAFSSVWVQAGQTTKLLHLMPGARTLSAFLAVIRNHPIFLDIATVIGSKASAGTLQGRA